MNTNKLSEKSDKNTTFLHFRDSYKHSLLDVWAFAEWCGKTFVRLNDCWVHKYADQRDEDNYKDTGELWVLWWENYRKVGYRNNRS